MRTRDLSIIADKNDKQQTINIYPNPATNIINFNNFIKNSNLSEFTLPGLTNNERRLMHEYAEKMDLIHESKGDKERVLFLFN